MSDLARAFVKSKLATLPPEAPLIEDPQDDDTGDSSSASSISSTGTIVPTSTHRAAATSQQPTPWTDFFAQELYLDTRLESNNHTAKYHVYLHPPANTQAPLFVLHQGAGSTGMSFALLTQKLRHHIPEAGVLSIDAREHGQSVVRDESGTAIADFSLTTLSQDLVNMINLTKSRLNWPAMPRLVLVGHSLGGAVVTHTAKTFFTALGNRIIGYAVLDVVEGSALEIVEQMSAYLRTRPSSFASIDQAIEWHVRSRTLRNPASARASVPPLLIENGEGRWTWRTDLASTESYWQDWFKGMSAKFLSARGAKLLILAGTDRLDKDLMIGQMQGKFQLKVFPAAGHFVHEDLPDMTAETLAEFFRRNDQSAIKLPPKVSDLLAQGKKV